MGDAPMSRPPSHGQTVNGRKSPTYVSCASAHDRCHNLNSRAFHNYGGRGIRVCLRWWDLTVMVTEVIAEIGLRPKGKTLDRVDNNRGYEPGNIRWATRSQQMKNRRPQRRLS